MQDGLFSLLRGQVVEISHGLREQQSHFAALEGGQIHVGETLLEASDGDELWVNDAEIRTMSLMVRHSREHRTMMLTFFFG